MIKKNLFIDKSVNFKVDNMNEINPRGGGSKREDGGFPLGGLATSWQLMDVSFYEVQKRRSLLSNERLPADNDE